MVILQAGFSNLLTICPDTISYVRLAQGMMHFHILDESTSLVFGPGYGQFLGLTFFIFGVNALAPLLIQIILSSVSCLLLYKLGIDLTGRRSIGLLAGYLAALSFTSISLATIILSDTLFFFLFLLGLVLFFRTLDNPRWRLIIISGLCLGCGLLVRSIGQFWPFVMVFLVVFMPIKDRIATSWKDRLRFRKRTLIVPLIALLFMSGWIVRNYSIHSVPILSLAGPHGVGKTTALAQARIYDKDYTDVLVGWVESYKKDEGLDHIEFVQNYYIYKREFIRTLKEHPFQLLRSCASLTKENIFVDNELYYAQLPGLSDKVTSLLGDARSYGIPIIWFWLTMAGFVAMVVLRAWRALLALGAIYAYFAAIVGFGCWQGSRLFFPAQIAWTIAIAFALNALSRIITNCFHKIRKSRIRFPSGGGYARRVKSLIRTAVSRAGKILEPFMNKYYFLFFCLVAIIGVITLYWKFFVSDVMFFSNDMIFAGVFHRQFLVDYFFTHYAIPLWNPYIFCGLPFVDSIHGDIFYPLSFLKYFLPVPRAIGWTFIIHIFLAGIFSYLTARQLGISRLGATFAGIAYMFSGWLNSHILPGHDSKIYVTALYPLLFLFAHRLFLRRPLINGTILGIVLGAIVLSPHPQMAYFSILSIAAYVCFRIVTDLPGDKKVRFIVTKAGFLTYAIAVGILLSAIQIFPSFIYTRNDSPRSEYQYSYDFATSWSLHEEEAVSLVVPEFAGANLPEGNTSYWGRNEFKNNSEYIGLVAMIMAFIGVVYSRRKDRFFYLLAAALSLLYALGATTPLFHIFYNYIPLVKMTRAPSMVMFIFSFAIAILGGIGIQELAQRNRSHVHTHSIFAVAGLVVLPAILLAGYILFATSGPEFLKAYGKLFYSQLLDNPSRLSAAEANLSAITSGFGFAFLLSSIVALIVFLQRFRKIGIVMLCLLPGLAAADEITFSSEFIHYFDYKYFFGPRPETTYIKARVGDYRAFGHNADEIGLNFAYHHIASPFGRHGNELLSYHKLLYRNWNAQGNLINPRFADLVGARYILLPKDTDLDSLDFGPGALVEDTVIYNLAVVENKACFPRVYLSGNYEVISSRDSMADLIYNGSNNLRQIVYLDSAPAIAIDSITDIGDTAEILAYDIDSVVIRAQCSTAKILTLTDNYYKDWHLYVDGREEEPLISYGVFRSAALAPGSHTVVWKYIPSDYRTGKYISCATLIFIALVPGIDWWRRRKRTG